MQTSFALSSLLVALCSVGVLAQDGLLPNYQLSGTFLLEPAQTMAFPMYSLPYNYSELYQQPYAYDPSIFQQPAFFIPQAPYMSYPQSTFAPMTPQFPVVAPQQAWPAYTNPRATVPTQNVNYPQLAQTGVPVSAPAPTVPTQNVNYPQLAQTGVPVSAPAPAPAPVAPQQHYYVPPTPVAAIPEAHKVAPSAAPAKAAPLTPCQLMMQRLMQQATSGQ